MNEATAAVPNAARPRRRPGWPLWLGLAALLLIVTLTVIWPQLEGGAAAQRSTTARVGFVAPEISVPQLVQGRQGATAHLSSLAGHPVVVNFWATWCVPCRQEFPAFQAKYQKYGASKGLIVVGVNAESDGGPSAAEQFVKDMGATFPIWLDSTGGAEEAYRVQALPTTVFVDRSGLIQDLIVGGPMTEDYMEKELERIF